MVSIVIVDDSRLIQKSLEIEFKKNNFFHLVFASRYSEAEKIISEEKNIFAAIVGMVLSDAPNGEVVDLFLSHKIPTIVLTGHVSDEIVKTFTKKPILDYVPKTSIHDILYTVEMIEVLFYFQDRKALIVDSNHSSRYSLSLLFKYLMLEPMVTTSGQEALAWLENDPSIQVVAIDCQIDDMDSVDLAQKINQKYSQRGLSLMAVTAGNEATLISKFIKSGADDVLAKPVTRESFNARIFKILSFKKKMFETDSYLQMMERHVLTSSTDENGIIRKLSRSFSELSGYSKEELIGNSHSMVRHEDMPDEVFADLWTTILSGEMWQGEVKNRKKDGGFYWVKAYISPVYNGSQKVIGYQSIRQDITDKKEVEEKSKQLEEAKKKITDSIEFSSIIQRAFLPSNKDIGTFFSDFFVHWEPKDIVGGDIYQFLIDGERSLLFIIDCTGHGVPGAFMTMVIKSALEGIVNETNFDNPALILQMLSKTIKSLLRQHDENSKSDVGLDGGIFFYDKGKDLVRYAGAKTPLFYIIGGKLHLFKGDRESIGYKKSDTHFAFTNFELLIDKESHFYITTDGYIDQNGGEGGYPYGKKSFQETLLQEHQQSFEKQKEILLEKLKLFQGDYERDDDITMSGFVIRPKDKKESKQMKEEPSNIFAKNFDDYNLDTMNELERVIEKHIHSEHPQRAKLEKVLTVLYEMGQNISKYAQAPQEISAKEQWRASLKAGVTPEGSFYLSSSNIVDHNQKERIGSRIEYVNALEPEALKEYYKELRRSGKYQHEQGAGLGFAELAKRSGKKLAYQFQAIDERYDYYTLTVYI